MVVVSFFFCLLDLSYEINPLLGFIYVKGKTDPQLILTKLKKGGKHATVQWISYGFPRDCEHQYQQVQQYPDQSVPFYPPRYPYETAAYNNQFNNPPYYPAWYNNMMPQNGGALPLPHGNHVLEHEHSGHGHEGNIRKRSFSGRSHDPQCPLHSKHHHPHSPLSSSQSGHTRVQNSSPPPPPIRSGITNDQTNNNQPTVSKQSSSCVSIKKIIDKLSCMC